MAAQIKGAGCRPRGWGARVLASLFLFFMLFFFFLPMSAFSTCRDDGESGGKTPLADKISAGHGPGPMAPGNALSTGDGYLNLIRVIARENGLDPTFLLAMIKAESNFNHRAVSVKGAKGLMQLMPSVCKDYGVGDPFDIQENIKAGTAYFKHLYERFGNLTLALAAYNAGPGNVSKYGGVPPFEETRQYIQRVLWYQDYYSQKDDYGKKQNTVSVTPLSGMIEKGRTALSQNDNSTAISLLIEAVRKFPDSAKAHYHLALACERVGEKLTAIALYRKTLSLDPQFGKAHLHLAVLYKNMGLSRRALASLKGYLKSETQ